METMRISLSVCMLVLLFGGCAPDDGTSSQSPPTPTDFYVYLEQNRPHLSWNTPGVSAGTTYDVERKNLAETSGFQRIGGDGSTLFIDWNAEPECTYEYRVRSVYADLYSDYTPLKQITLLSEAEIEIRDVLGTVLENGKSQISMGSYSQFAASPEVDLPVTNIGSSNLRFTAPLETNPSDLLYAWLPDGELSPDSSVDLTVQARTEQPGSHTVTLTLHTNDETDKTYTLVFFWTVN
ncbi:MAG: hypothetical protein Kow009_05620 [Spirochaetales bacterium]